MELAQVRAFVTAADCGSFSRAAELLDVAQPSLSNRILTLERELGQQLFERLGRGVRLTDAGRVFLPHAQRALRSLDDGSHLLAAAREGTAGQITIGAAPAVGTYVLPNILKSFCNVHPGIEVVVRTGHSDEVAEMVLDDDAQVGFGRPINHPDLHTVVLFHDQLVLVVPADHQLAEREAVRPEELADEALALFDRDSGYYGMILGLFREQGVMPRHQMQLDSIEATKKMVEAGLGIALLPERSVDREVRLRTLHKIRIDSPEPVRRDIAVMYRRRKPASGAMSALLGLLGETFRLRLPA